MTGAIIEERAMKPLSERNPKLAYKIAQMRLHVAPIIHVITGAPAPDFPSTMLQLFLLTEDQLDALAHYYSQIVPCEFTHAYPQAMRWDQEFLSKDTALPENCRLSDLERVKVKMRLFARFIGIRGANTPTWEHERGFEIFRNKIAKSVREEEDDDDLESRKFYRGPMTRPK